MRRSILIGGVILAIVLIVGDIFVYKSTTPTTSQPSSHTASSSSPGEARVTSKNTPVATSTIQSVNSGIVATSTGETEAVNFQWAPVPKAAPNISSNDFYWLNSGRVQYSCAEGPCYLSSADPATFVVGTSTAPLAWWVSGLAKDKNHVYSEGLVVDNADPVTFAPLFSATSSPTLFARDTHAIYDCSGPEIAVCSPMTNVNVATFVALNEDYGKDASHVFYIGYDATSSDIVTGADPSSFTVFAPYGATAEYARDNNNVYYDGQILQGADPQSFTVIPQPDCTGYCPNTTGGIDARDKSHTYLNGYVVH